MNTHTRTPTTTPDSPIKHTPRLTITTTLYDVLAALQTYVGPAEEHLTTAIVVHLLRSGQITFPGNRKAHIV